ncbi:MAG: 2Fe-2S iron-sulfur cluster-binding protein [Comamonadaceae bacterium]|nr:2Fe-2S iron-sulfur cluster-binding protein [Comamonadaceae bacterium]
MGACRVCVVEVQGARSLVASCAMPAEKGMIVTTNSERVLAARKLTVELLLTQGHHNCLVCESNGDCVLQSLAYSLGIDTPRFAEPAELQAPGAGQRDDRARHEQVHPVRSVRAGLQRDPGEPGARLTPGAAHCQCRPRLRRDL